MVRLGSPRLQMGEMVAVLVKRVFFVGGALIGVVFIALGTFGYPSFTRADEDAVRKVDAIIVLGGEHDGREGYGLELARAGVASTVVMSDPYPRPDQQMDEACSSRVPGVEVICVPPDPSTTRGEAILTRELARERGWESVLVVSWRYHLPRARHIFEQCFSDHPDAVVMRAVPRQYEASLGWWMYIYLYQSLGYAKNSLLDSGCGA